VESVDGGMKQESDSLLPLDDANDTLPSCGDEVRSPVLFSSPSVASDDGCGDTSSNRIESVIGILMADETGSPVQDEKPLADKAAETGVGTWDLDNIDEFLRDQQFDLYPVSPLTDRYQPVGIVQPSTVADTGFAGSQSNISVASSDQYFAQLAPTLSVMEPHCLPASQPPQLPPRGNPAGVVQPLAVADTGTAGSLSNMSVIPGDQNDTSSLSSCLYCNHGNYSVSFLFCTGIEGKSWYKWNSAPVGSQPPPRRLGV